jgi:CelD/BcsL family acetyltransferase involved in cellulose biosynthesis
MQAPAWLGGLPDQIRMNVSKPGAHLLQTLDLDQELAVADEVPQRHVSVGGLTASCLSTPSELEAFSGEWQELFRRIACRTPFLSLEWMVSWWRHWGEGNRLFIVVVRQVSGRVVAIAPFYLRRSMYGPFGPRGLCFLAHKWVGSDHLNILVDPEHESFAIQTMLGFLEAQRAVWDYIELADSEDASQTFTRLCDGLKALGMVHRVTHSEICPYTALPSSFDEYLAGVGANLRYNFRRRRRALEREGAFKFTVLKNQAELQEHFGELVRLHGLRFEHQLKYSSFLAPHIQDFHADALKQMAASGMARLCLLQIGERVIGALYGFSAGRTFSFYQTGIDPAWQRLSVGLVMMGCAIEEAIRTGHDRYDFLRGDEAYKFQWAHDSRRASTHYFFDRRLRSRCAWPEVLAKRYLMQLARRIVAVVNGLFPQGTVDRLVNIVNASLNRPSSH